MGKNLGFAMGFMICLCAGTLYAWGVVKNEVMEVFDWTQSEVATVYIVGAFGQYIGFPSGRVYDWYGPRACGIYSLIWVIFGYSMMYLQVTTKFSTSPLVMGIFFACVGQGSIGMYMMSMLTNSGNFPSEQRGFVVGAMAAAFGLSAAVFSNVYKLFFQKAQLVDEYLLMVTVVIGIVLCTGIAVLKKEQPPMAVHAESLSGHSPLIDVEKSINAPQKEEEKVITGTALLTNIDFIALFFMFGLCAGSGLVVIGELADMAVSNGYSVQAKLSMIAMVSYANCAGRFIIGTASDRTLQYCDRTFWIIVVVLCMLFSQLSMYFFQGLPGALWFGAIGIALSYGGLFAITPVFVSEKFGYAAYGFNFGTLTLSLAFGNTLLTGISARMYDTVAEANHTCVGAYCFESTFLLLAASNFVGLFFAALLSVRSKQARAGYDREPSMQR